jgi:DNA-binding protein HU-beta
MTKQDLVNKVAESGITKKQAGAAVEAVVEAIKEALAAGDKVNLVGFGSFSIRERAAREGRNPRTGKKLNISAKKVPVFKAGKELKESV